MSSMILHIVTRNNWVSAQALGSYSGDTLASEGFIHCSMPEQVLLVANARFFGRADLVILVIDPSKVLAKIRYEDGGGGELFPHIYGPLNLDAVASCLDFPAQADGSFLLPDLPVAYSK